MHEGTPKPRDFLGVCRERKVKVNILGNRELFGMMQGFDEHSNLVLSEITETLTVTDTERKHTRSLRVLFVRGDRMITVFALC
jgi:small nuclear ribonucleoprotein (snRNP)-like protein